MPGNKPDIVKVYRIVHIDNIEYLLSNGLYRRGHPNADPDYINIGDSTLIAQRHDHPVGIEPPGGTLGEYVPFYFGPLSPMLFNIKTGHRGITRRPQQDIVYIVCRVSEIVEQCEEWCFTDGHAKQKITTFYNDLDDLGEVNWNIVGARYWSNTEDDFDKMRTKQAEFLVKEYVPVNCISAIVTFNNTSASIVKEILERLNLDIKVVVNPGGHYYY